jgi:hypothetical protein
MDINFLGTLRKAAGHKKLVLQLTCPTGLQLSSGFAAYLPYSCLLQRGGQAVVCAGCSGSYRPAS